MNDLYRENKKITWKDLNAKIITTVLGIALAIAGMNALSARPALKIPGWVKIKIIL